MNPIERALANADKITAANQRLVDVTAAAQAERRGEPVGWLSTQDRKKAEAALARVSERAKGYAQGDEWFALWLDLVSRRLIRVVGVSVHDLSDCNLRDMYEAGDSPGEAALQALQADDTYSALVGGE